MGSAKLMLTQEQLEQYHEDGFPIVRNFGTLGRKIGSDNPNEK